MILVNQLGLSRSGVDFPARSSPETLLHTGSKMRSKSPSRLCHCCWAPAFPARRQWPSRALLATHAAIRQKALSPRRLGLFWHSLGHRLVVLGTAIFSQTDWSGAWGHGPPFSAFSATICHYCAANQVCWFDPHQLGALLARALPDFSLAAAFHDHRKLAQMSAHPNEDRGLIFFALYDGHLRRHCRPGQMSISLVMSRNRTIFFIIAGHSLSCLALLPNRSCQPASSPAAAEGGFQA